MNLKDFFIGVEGAFYVIYLATELDRTLRGYLDYIYLEFSGLSAKLKD